MSRNWAVALIAVSFLSLGTALAALVAPRPLEAAKKVEPANPPRIAYVNIAKVLREFQKANADGKKLNAKREEYLQKIKPLRELLAAKARELQAAVNPNERDALQKDAVALNHEIEKIDKDAQKTLGEATDQTIVAVFQDVRGVIADLAQERGFDVVECYPDASNPEDFNKPAVAQLKLQTSALIPFYVRKEFDATDDVIERLNKKYPPVKDDAKK